MRNTGTHRRLRARGWLGGCLGPALLIWGLAACEESSPGDEAPPEAAPDLGLDAGGTGGQDGKLDVAHREAGAADDGGAHAATDGGRGDANLRSDAQADGSSEGPSPGPEDAGASPDPECGPDQHVDEQGVCQEDVCVDGSVTCRSPRTAQRCAEDGSRFELIACYRDEVCREGECRFVGCEPSWAPDCEGNERRVCLPDGSDYERTPCPAGTGCLEGDCVALAANVVILVDSSAAMAQLHPEGTPVEACVGDDCPAWQLPHCEDSAAPRTRLGRVKSALGALLEGAEIQGQRLTLQRFPQGGAAPGTDPACDHGHYGAAESLSGHGEEHAVEAALLEEELQAILPAPFDPSGSSNLQALQRLVDFEERVEASELACASAEECPSGLCADGLCQHWTNPELRGLGPVALGRGLFYSGEYLRHLVLRQGQHCVEDEDCGSPNHRCFEGRCDDPLVECRPNVIIVLAFGAETLNPEPGDFFNPRIQAKRLHYGLGCERQGECLQGAVCRDGVCSPPLNASPAGACRGTNRVCISDDDCVDYPCDAPGGSCAGRCEDTGLDFVAPVGSNSLHTSDGAPVSATVHVVNASGLPGRHILLSMLGGGRYVTANLDNLEGLRAAVAELLPPPVDLNACP